MDKGRLACDLQHHQAAQPAEGLVWDVADAVEGERHGLQGGQVPQSLHRHLPQRVVVQPQMAQRAQARKTASGDVSDVVSIQAAADRKTKGADEDGGVAQQILDACFLARFSVYANILGRLMKYQQLFSFEQVFDRLSCFLLG